MIGSPLTASSWRRFSLTFAATVLLVTLALYAFIWILDPYGVRASPSRAPSPIMDLNQRFMYPQIVRGGRYDAAVFGTSTIRLLDPERLSAAFGARFANLGLNAGTPWEQIQLATFFLHYVPQPKMLIFGLDPTWCEPDADRKRLTFRAFPPWLYDESRLNDLPELLNLKTLEIAARLALFRLGLMPERIRADGYEVFVPPESAYDLARARLHLYGSGRQEIAPPVTPAAALSPEAKTAMRTPALPWLDDVLGRVPRGTPLVLAFMPIHAAAQPVPGSIESARDEECKARIVAIGRRHGATVVDFRRRSPVTTEDANYWDPLHYRVGIAERIVAALRQARDTGRDAIDGFYRVLAPSATN
jgi:hypothetical protein